MHCSISGTISSLNLWKMSDTYLQCFEKTLFCDFAYTNSISGTISSLQYLLQEKRNKRFSKYCIVEEFSSLLLSQCRWEYFWNYTMDLGMISGIYQLIGKCSNRGSQMLLTIDTFQSFCQWESVTIWSLFLYKFHPACSNL